MSSCSQKPWKVILDSEALHLLASQQQPITSPGIQKHSGSPFILVLLILLLFLVFLTSINFLRCKTLFPGKCERLKHTHAHTSRHVMPPHQEMEKTAAQFIKGSEGKRGGWRVGVTAGHLALWPNDSIFSVISHQASVSRHRLTPPD